MRDREGLVQNVIWLFDAGANAAPRLAFELFNASDGFLKRT
jgi:hypothetical protein